MKAVINVSLKNGVLDPQGKAVEHALGSLGFKNVSGVRIGKQIVLDIKGSSPTPCTAPTAGTRKYRYNR